MSGRPMEEEYSSWLRRTKFSHTVCHRFDSAKLASVPVRFRTREIPVFKPKPESSGVDNKVPEPQMKHKIQQNPLTNKQRSVSPLPQTSVSEVFKEAQLEKKRFSTPVPRRKEPDKRISKSFNNRESPEKLKSKVMSRQNTSPMRSSSPFKGFGKMKGRKDSSSWSKYFDHGGGKVTAVEAADEYMVDLSQLFLGLRFAYGAHSRLYHGIYKDEAVAVKIIRVPDNDENGELAARLAKQFNREVGLLSRLHHPNVIKFMAACRQPPVYCIVTEYLSEGSLRSYLHKLEREPVALPKLIPVALGIARGMDYIHSQGVIHRDLKPENILIDENFQMKIADFGIACEEVHCDPFADDPGTYRWMAPEMIRDRPYGRKVDVYSFGLILWEMVTGNTPYEGKNPVQAAFAVLNKSERPDFPKDCPQAMRTLIEQCWSFQPEKRPEFWQVVKVLEQFESSLACGDVTLKSVQNSIFQEKKSFLYRIQKLGSPDNHSNSMPKPKFN